MSVFSVAPDGTLTQVTGSPFATGTNPNSATFSPSGGLLATANEGGTVSIFAVASDGTLTQVVGSPYNAGNSGSPFSVAFSPSGGLVASANGNGVSVFSVASDGALTQVPGSPFNTTGVDTNISVAFSPIGGLLATTLGGAAAAESSLAVYSVSSHGTLTPVKGSPYGTGSYSEPFSASFSPSGRLLATADHQANVVSMFSTSPPRRSEISAELRRELVPRGPAARLPALVHQHGFRLRFTALSSGRVVIDWYYLPKGARIASAKPKAVLIAVGKAKFSRAQTMKIKIRLNATGERLLKRADRLRMTARGSFTPTAERAVVSIRTLTLRQ